MKNWTIYRWAATGRNLSARCKFVAVLAVCVMAPILIWLAAELAKDQDPITAMDVELVGRDYRFQFRYPGADQRLHTADDRSGSRDLYVPENAVVHLRLTSQDYIYTFEIPALEVYEVAAPDLTFEVRFVANRAGSYDLLGSQMCGYEHAELLGKLVVQPEADLRRTLRGLSKFSP